MRRSWTSGAKALLLAVAAISLAAGAPAAPADTVRVTIDNFTFSPAELKVEVGTTVTWLNRDDMPHTIVAEDKSFRSAAIDTDESFSHTFTRPGEFRYYCSIHPRMVGRVVVAKRE